MRNRKRFGNPFQAVGYLRVSTDEQALGPEAQRATVQAWAAREGVAIVAWHLDDGVSGAAPLEARRGLAAALGDLRARDAGLLVVQKRDRLARDVVVAAMVERAVRGAGARVISADGTGNGDTPADAFMRTVIDGAAAYERALIRQRTREALRAKKVRGERVGGIPYGFRLGADGVHLVRNDEEQRIIAEAWALRAAGLTLAQVRESLAARGMVNRKGRPFSLPALHHMVKTAA